MFLNFFKKKEDIYLALDIGDSSIKALFFKKITELKKPAKESTGNEKIAVLASTINYFEKIDGILSQNSELEVIKKAVSGAIEQLRKNIFFSKTDKYLKKRIEKGRIPVLVSLPCQKLKAVIFSQNFLRKNFKNKISAKEESNIQKELLKKAKENIESGFVKGFNVKMADISWVSFKIISKKIEGYTVSCLQDCKGKEITFEILAIFSLKPYIDNIKNIIKSLRMDFQAIIHISEILPRLYYNKKEDREISFIDVGSKTTQFFLIKDNVLKEINEIKRGGSYFTKIIIERLGLDEKSAELLKEKYSSGLLSLPTEKKLKEFFSSEQKEWYNELKERIYQTSEKNILSFNIYIFGGGAKLPEIKAIIEKEKEKEQFAEQIFFPSLNKVKVICPKDLEWILNLPQDVNNPQLVPALLIASSVI